VKFVVKLGGATIEDKKLLHECGKAISELVRDGNQVAVVHGGGKQLTATLAQMGKKSEFVSGLRITDAETRDAALMVLAGRVNKSLVAALRTHGQSAMGLAGGDGNVFRARKKKTVPDLGFVGEIAATDPLWLEAIWKMDAVPVISSIALGFDGEYYNINADEMAAACAICTKADALVFLTDVPGVKGRGRQVMRWLSLKQIPELERQMVVSGGMLPKLAACREALTHGVKRVTDSARGGGAFIARPLLDQGERWNGGYGRMKLESIQAAEKKLLLNTYERNPVLFTGGKGVYLRDAEGNEYLDLLSGIGVSALGYGHPAVEAAIVAQTKTAAAHLEPLLSPRAHGRAGAAADGDERAGPRLLLQQRHRGVGGGAEAGARACRLLRAEGQAARHEVSRAGAQLPRPDHGLGCDHAQGEVPRAVCAGDAGRGVCPLQRCCRSAREVFDEVCGICIEAIQGEGGIHPVSQEFFAAARELCDSTGALLLADEIQSGMGRTGEWFAYQHYGILPDITTLAKPIANGLPMGAMLCTDEAARAITPGMHGTTFGGGPRWPARWPSLE
jgi:acetylglutamate kinase